MDTINFTLTTGIDADVEVEPGEDAFARAALSGVADLFDLVKHDGIGVSVTIGGETRRFDVLGDHAEPLE